MPSLNTERRLDELEIRGENRVVRGSSLTHNLSRHLSHNLVALYGAAGFFIAFTQAALVTPNRESNACACAADESSVEFANTWNTITSEQSGGVKLANASCECAPVSHTDLQRGNPRTATDGRTVLIFNMKGRT